MSMISSLMTEHGQFAISSSIPGEPWPGKRLLVSPNWIERVSWNESKVFVDVQREAIKKSPEYTKESLLSRDYETLLHRHYDRQGYWVDEPAVEAQSIEHAFFQEGIVILNQVSRGIGEHKGAALALIETAS